MKNGIQKIVFALLLAVIFSLGLMKPRVETGLAAITPTDLVFPILLVFWLAGIATGSVRFRWNRRYWSFAIYFAALLISSIFSIDPARSFIKLAGIAYLLLLAAATDNLVTTTQRFRAAALAWLAGAALPILTALLGISVFYISPDADLLRHITYHYGAVPVGNFPRISSTFISPSMFINYLTVTLVLTIVSVWMGWMRKVTALILVGTIALASLFTVSIGLGGFVLVAGLLLLVNDGRETLAARAGVALSIVIAAAFLAIAPISLSVASGIAPSSRLLVWKDSLETFFVDPFTGKGVGTGAASIVYRNFDGTWSLLTDAHNVFLNILAESGIPGLIGIMAVIASVLSSAFSATALSNVGLARLRTGLGLAFLSAFLFQGLTGSYEDARHVWVLIGLVFAAERISTAGKDADPTST